MLFDSGVDYYSLNNPLVYLLSESSNLIFCFLFIFIFFILKKINSIEAIFWAFLFIFAFLINLFINQNQFPDIGGYLRCVRDLRDNFYFDEIGCQLIQSGGEDNLTLYSFKRGLPAIIYSLIPMPSIATFASIGLINKLYIFFIYIFLKPFMPLQRNLVILAILMILPSVLLYSSLGLRDNLIFCSQVLLLFSIIKRYIFFSTILLIILSAIKIQNGIVFSFLYLGIFVFQADKSLKALALYSLLVLISMFIMGDILLATLNYFKLAFLSEDNAIANLDSYVPFKSVLEIIIISPISLLEGLIRPFPQSISSGIFFLESLLHIFIITLLLKSNMKKFFYNPQFLIVLFTFFIGIILNSLVIENDFTYSRYKFTFLSMFVIYLLTFKNSIQKTI